LLLAEVIDGLNRGVRKDQPLCYASLEAREEANRRRDAIHRHLGEGGDDSPARLDKLPEDGLHDDEVERNE
jgi:hypothetical protein|tara:strand:- start:150 stop:362 length:213 start_codon:yes stop_codon:yes gene_type:complete